MHPSRLGRGSEPSPVRSRGGLVAACALVLAGLACQPPPAPDELPLGERCPSLLLAPRRSVSRGPEPDGTYRLDLDTSLGDELGRGRRIDEIWEGVRLHPDRGAVVGGHTQVTGFQGFSSRRALRFDPAELTCGLVGGEWACSTPVRYRAAVHVRARGWCVYAADGLLVIPVDLHTESVPAWTTRDGHVRVWAAAEDRPDLAVAGVWEMLDDAVEFSYQFDEHGYVTSPRPER